MQALLQPKSKLNQLRRIRGLELKTIFLSMQQDEWEKYYDTLSHCEIEDLNSALTPIANENENSSS